MYLQHRSLYNVLQTQQEGIKTGATVCATYCSRYLYKSYSYLYLQTFTHPSVMYLQGLSEGSSSDRYCLSRLLIQSSPWISSKIRSLPDPRLSCRLPPALGITTHPSFWQRSISPVWDRKWIKNRYIQNLYFILFYFFLIFACML